MKSLQRLDNVQPKAILAQHHRKLVLHHAAHLRRHAVQSLRQRHSSLQRIGKSHRQIKYPGLEALLPLGDQGAVIPFGEIESGAPKDAPHQQQNDRLMKSKQQKHDGNTDAGDQSGHQPQLKQPPRADEQFDRH